MNNLHTTIDNSIYNEHLPYLKEIEEHLLFDCIPNYKEQIKEALQSKSRQDALQRIRELIIEEELNKDNYIDNHDKAIEWLSKDPIKIMYYIFHFDYELQGIVEPSTRMYYLHDSDTIDHIRIINTYVYHVGSRVIDNFFDYLENDN